MNMDNQSGRLYALDGLRAVMMFLGVVIHSFESFVTFPLAAWTYSDPMTSFVADIIVVFIHAFRMPVFLSLPAFLRRFSMKSEASSGYCKIGFYASPCPL